MSAAGESPRAPARPGTRRLKLLIGLLLLAGIAFIATASFRERTQKQTALIRREVEDSERVAREERERRERHERVRLLEQLATDPENVDLLLRAASLYGQDRRYEEAVFMLQEARRLAPDNVEVYRGLYQVYVAQGHYDRAYDYATEGLRRAPQDLELVLGLVHLDTLVGWNSLARATLRQLEGTPHADNPRARIASALVYRQVTDSRHAEAELQEALAREPNNDTAYALLSGVRWEVGRGKEAEAAIRKALELKPDDPDYLLHLAEIQIRSRTPEGVEVSRQTAERALQAEPGNRNAFFAIANALLAQRRTAEAQEMLERLLARYPDHYHASYELSQLYLRSGRQAEAERLLAQHAEGVRLADERKSLTLKVGMLLNSAPVHVELGKLYNDTGDYDKAVLVLRRALQLKPADREARRQLARALAAADRSGEYAELGARPQWHVVDLLDPGPGRQ